MPPPPIIVVLYTYSILNLNPTSVFVFVNHNGYQQWLSIANGRMRQRLPSSFPVLLYCVSPYILL